MNDVNVLVRTCGRSDDGRHAVLRQEHDRGASFLWPDADDGPENPPDFDGFTRGLLTIRDGREFDVRVAGSRVFFKSPRADLSLFFDLLPKFPPRVDIEIDSLPGEVDEGTEFRPPPAQPTRNPASSEAPLPQ